MFPVTFVTPAVAEQQIPRIGGHRSVLLTCHSAGEWQHVLSTFAELATKRIAPDKSPARESFQKIHDVSYRVYLYIYI